MGLRRVQLLGIKNKVSRNKGALQRVKMKQNRLARATQNVGSVEGRTVSGKYARFKAYDIMTTSRMALTPKQKRIIGFAKGRTAYAKELLALRRKKKK